MGLGFEFGNLLIQKGTGVFHIVDIVGIAQPAFAAQFLGGAAARGFEGFRFFMGLCQGHVIEEVMLERLPIFRLTQEDSGHMPGC